MPRTALTRRCRLAALAAGFALALATAAPACAEGPREEVNAAINRLLTARSYVATIAGSDGRAEQVEFAAPGRWRVRSGDDEQVIVGDTLYRRRDGQHERLVLPQEALARWRDPVKLAEHPETMDVVALPDEVIAGVTARKYRIDTPAPMPHTLLLWIGQDGYPLQVLAPAALPAPGGTTVRYSRFNDPGIRIEPPR